MNTLEQTEAILGAEKAHRSALIRDNCRECPHRDGICRMPDCIVAALVRESTARIRRLKAEVRL